MTSLRRFVTLFESLEPIPHVDPEPLGEAAREQDAAAEEQASQQQVQLSLD